MSIVDLIWACASYDHSSVQRKNAEGELYAERIHHDGPCRMIQMQNSVMLDYVGLGVQFGWQPMGAQYEDRKSSWPGFEMLKPGMNVLDSYNPGKIEEFKIVLAEDAAAWAEALEKAAAAMEAGSLDFAFTRGERTFREGMTAKEFADINNRPDTSHIRAFIEFLKQGPFEFYYDD